VVDRVRPAHSRRDEMLVLFEVLYEVLYPDEEL
jgi:hypothetical protein